MIENNIINKETLLTPRFYTTNFKELSQLDISSNQDEIEAIIEEFRFDYNCNYFIRDKEFLKSSEFFDQRTQRIFIDFLIRSCTAEFSGFLLYKEISRNLKKSSPILSEGFAFMSRDEARHAGFLNKAISDFNVSLDLGFLTKTRHYTFFAPKFILYATYISEKIGYWRYITIYRFLEKNPKNRINPIFKFFENWCQDENRHGDFFAAILKSQPYLLNNFSSKLWCKFFLLAVFVTMYLNDLQRTDFYLSIGLDVRQFNKYVIRKTNQSVGIVFPVILDVDNPLFFLLLEQLHLVNQELCLLEERSIKNIFNSFPLYLKLFGNFFKMYCLPVISTNSI